MKIHLPYCEDPTLYSVHVTLEYTHTGSLPPPSSGTISLEKVEKNNSLFYKRKRNEQC